MKNELLIIIPAYNEEDNIGKVLTELQQLLETLSFDVLVINDASTDRTAAIVKEKGFKVVNLIYNMGYGCGLQTGYKYAVRHGYKYVIQMDADGQHDTCNIKELYKALTGTDKDGKHPDIVIGSRFLPGAAVYHCSKIRRFAMKVFSRQIKHATKVKITDPTSGLQGLSSRAFTYYQGYNHFDERYPDANMIMQMILLGFKVTEIPAVMHNRAQGVGMHSGIKPFIYMLRMAFCILAVAIRIKVFHVDMGVPDHLI